ncbi:hypothetical protein LCGC14_2356550 [marine sediment metagenome]|uniref:Uncharacterized protein n=1 Tax=marine sediment metagenome TaxID=412755 RepID=A0A0F9CV48_9ZZZZ
MRSICTNKPPYVLRRRKDWDTPRQTFTRPGGHTSYSFEHIKLGAQLLRQHGIEPAVTQGKTWIPV